MISSRNDILEKISHDLLSVSPQIYRGIRKKLIMSSLSSVDLRIGPLHLGILRLLYESGEMPMNKIGESLHIPKAQMTHLVDRLVDITMVERQTDFSDRRVTNILLTQTGREFVSSHDAKLMTAAKEMLSSLTDDELEEMSVSLNRLHQILLKTM